MYSDFKTVQVGVTLANMTVVPQHESRKVQKSGRPDDLLPCTGSCGTADAYPSIHPPCCPAFNTVEKTIGSHALADPSRQLIAPVWALCL